MRRRWCGPAPAALFLSLALLASACDDGGSTPKASSTTTRAAATPSKNVDGTLTFGQLAPVTGSLAPIQQSLTRPVQMAVDEINLAGGLNGTPMRVVVADDGSTSTNIARASLAKLLTTDRADVILGPASSGTALDLLPDVRDRNLLQCSGSNTRSELSTADSGGRYFRTSPPDSLQGPALAQLVVRDGHKKPVILARNDSYGADLAETMVPALRKLGIAPAGDVIAYAPSGADAPAKVKQALARKPDSVVILGLADDGAAVVRALVAAGAPPATLPTLTVDGLQSSTFGELVDPAQHGVVAGIRGTAPAAAPSGIDNPFIARFAATGTDPVFSAYYYDCAILSALAAVKAGTDDPAKLRAAFSKNLRGDLDCSTFAECKAALMTGREIHYRGASSRFERWRGHEPGSGSYEVWYYDPNARVVTAPGAEQIRVPGA